MSDPYAFDDDAKLEPLDDDEEIELDVEDVDDPDPWAKTSSGDDDDL